MTSGNGHRLSRAQVQQRQQAAVKHGAYATPSALRLRQRKLRRRVRSLKAQFPVLASAPDHLVQRYAEVDLIAANVFAALIDNDVVTRDGEPKRLLSEYRLLLAELRSVAGALGILSPADVDPLSTLLGRKP